MTELDVQPRPGLTRAIHPLDDRRGRDDSDPRAARPDLPRQPLRDDASVDDRHPDPHLGGARRRGLLRRRGRGAARDRGHRPAGDRPALVGEDPFRIERLWELARPATFDILRDRRLGLVATACVDTALWDLIGKALGQPLHRLWGGYRDSLPVITIGGYYGKHDVAEEVAELRERGLAGMKFKVGGLSPEEDAERFRVARTTAGPDFVLCADANQGWTPDRRSGSRGRSPISTCTGSRSRASGRTTAARCATSATQGASASAPVRASSRPAAAAT